MTYRWENIRFRVFVILVAVLALIAPITAYLVAGAVGLEIVGITATLLLTLALVVLYFQQFTVLDRQTTVMQRDYESALNTRRDPVADEDEVSLSLRNGGRGKIHRVYLQSEIVSDTGDLEVAPGIVPMKNADTGELELPAHSDTERFTGTVLFRILSFDNIDPDRGWSFRYVSRYLSEQGIDTCELKLTLQIRDEGRLHEEYSYEVPIAEQELTLHEPKEVEIDGETVMKPQSTTLEEAIKHNHSTGQDINRVSLEEIREHHPIID